MAPAGFEKYTDNMVGALNYSVDRIYPEILNIMSVRVIAAFLFHSNRKLDSSKQMTT